MGDIMVELIPEPTYSFGSADNTRRYITEVLLDADYIPSVYGLLVDGIPTIIVGAAGGATRIHEHSLLRFDKIIYFAIGQSVCRITLGETCLDWSVQIDDATCFGIYFSEKWNALISHGELALSRFTPEGTVLWTSDCGEILTGDFSLLDDYIEVFDFDGQVHHIDYLTGCQISKR